MKLKDVVVGMKLSVPRPSVPYVVQIDAIGADMVAFSVLEPVETVAGDVQYTFVVSPGWSLPLSVFSPGWSLPLSVFETVIENAEMMAEESAELAPEEPEVLPAMESPVDEEPAKKRKKKGKKK